ncbi:hypothetical protein KSP39_PZI017376 [Platanthera zijinensis]|uniref:Uncharacterized protein n=1 Tax=Platanthera zijinensis TaxID=2320716 RepID=A0AAP0B4P8_9ASPA
MGWYYRGGLKGYGRLDGEDGPTRRKVRSSKIELGGGRRRRFWPIRVFSRLRFQRAVISPSRFLISRIRGAYVQVMLAFASSGAVGSYGGDGMDAFYDASPIKEYDERMVLQLYKSVISQGQFIPTRRMFKVLMLKTLMHNRSQEARMKKKMYV